VATIDEQVDVLMSGTADGDVRDRAKQWQKTRRNVPSEKRKKKGSPFAVFIVVMTPAATDLHLAHHHHAQIAPISRSVT
jgi:hypothetical protein